MAMNEYELADWQGYLTRGEVDALKKCVNLLLKEFDSNPLIIVNIGAGSGCSTISMLKESDRILVFSVDIQATGNEYATNEHLRLDEMGLKNRVIRVWGDSKVVGKLWPSCYKVHMVFVDGDHEDVGIRGDIMGWIDKISTGGIIAYHDYHSVHWPKVAEVVDLLMKDKEKILRVDTTIAFKV